MSPIACLEVLLPSSLRPVMRGLLAYGSAEAGTRVLRIFAIIVIARQMPAEQIGIAALALALFELVRVLANSGIGQRIIVARDDELEAVCKAASRLFYLWCASIALVQLAVATFVWLIIGQGEIALMLATLTLVYAFMPPGLVQVFLLMRDGRLGTTARIAATQTCADHFLCMALALIWPTAWALVLPKLLTAPVWLVMVRRARQWRAVPSVQPTPARQFLRFGAGVLGTELTNVARQQLDKLIVGTLLGTEALGYYYFAFNAGLGITTSFVGALSIVLLPHLSATQVVTERVRRLRQALVFALAVFGPVILAQVFLSVIYVPLIFGSQWAPLAPLVAILALASLPAIFSAICTAWLRANGRTEGDASISLVACIAALVGLSIGCAGGISGAALGYVAALWLVQLPLTAFVILRPISATRTNTPSPTHGAVA